MTFAACETTATERPIATASVPPALSLMDFQPIPELESEASEPGDLVHSRSLVERQPRSGIAHARLAQSLLCYGKAAEAVEVASRAAVIARDSDPDAVTAAALVLLTGGQLGKAESVLGRQATPMARFLFALCAAHRRDYGKAIARLKGTDTYEALALTGWLHLQQAEFKAAIHAFRSALEVGEATPDVMTNLAYAHAALGNRKSAARAASIAVAMAPADNAASSNLAAARLGSRDFDGALKELRRLEAHRPDDLTVPMRIAAVYRQIGEVKKSDRMLRSLRSDRRYFATSRDGRADLRTFLALLDLQRGKVGLGDSKDRIQGILAEGDFQNLSVARALVSICTRTSDAERVRNIVDSLGERHRKEAFFWASSQLAFLELRFDDALREAEDWLRVDPFCSSAVAQVQYFLNDLKENYGEAARIGRQFFRRMDEREVVLNNTAYALVLNGELGEAHRLLLRATESPTSVATAGLLLLRAGRSDAAAREYDRAAKLAKSRGELDLVELLHARKAIEFGATPEDLQRDFPRLDKDVRFLFMLQLPHRA